MIRQLQRIDGGTSPWDATYTFNYTVYRVYDHLIFADEINEYPSVCVAHRGERITHIGGGIRLHTTLYEIRGYTHSDTVEQSGEALASDIEHVIDNFRHWTEDSIDYRLISVRTDGGVLAPLGVCIIEVEKLQWVS